MIINGKQYNYEEGITVSDMLENLNINKEKVVVEVNYNIIDKNDYEIFSLKDQDSIEIISFVGGG